MSDRRILTGVIPVAPTIFDSSENLDLLGQRRVTEFLVNANVDGICVLANYSEQFSLTEAERDPVIASTLEAAGGTPVMVAASHYSSQVTHARVQRAAEQGAQIVMLMTPAVGRTMAVQPARVVEYFQRAVDDLDVDIMIQDAPLSATDLSVDTLAKVVERVPQVRYIKVEVPGTARKLEEIRREIPDLLGLFDGEEAVTLIPDLDAGARGTMCSALMASELGTIVRLYLNGDRDNAEQQWERLLPLIQYENRQCGLAAAKVILAEGGVIASDTVRHPYPPLAPQVRAELIRLSRSRSVHALGLNSDRR